MNFNKFVQPVRSLIRLGAVCGTKGCGQGRNQKRLVGVARVKKIKCLGKKNIIFYYTNFIFQRTKGVPGRRLAPTLVPPLAVVKLEKFK
jgi:hypothetical protein